MANKNIGREASKGGKARWKGISKAKRREFAMQGVYTRRALRAIRKEQKEETPA